VRLSLVLEEVYKSGMLKKIWFNFVLESHKNKKSFLDDSRVKGS